LGTRYPNPTAQIATLSMRYESEWWKHWGKEKDGLWFRCLVWYNEVYIECELKVDLCWTERCLRHTKLGQSFHIDCDLSMWLKIDRLMWCVQ
jgi:hypothetical protein